jgi:hypothetical protein
MGIRCLLYVSESCLSWPDDAHEVDDIVAAARSRNEQLGLTGALIYTRTHFAQVLEGEAESIEAKMASIRGDARHRNLCVVADEPIVGRYFPDWTMAYSGPSFYVDRQIRPLLTDATDPARRRRAAAGLLAFIREFAVGPRPAGA